jgi:hypothetical protein
VSAVSAKSLSNHPPHMFSLQSPIPPFRRTSRTWLAVPPADCALQALLTGQLTNTFFVLPV